MSSDEPGARVRFPPPLVFLPCTLAGIALEPVAAPVRLPIGLAARVAIGIATQVFAVSLVVWARILFGRTGQSPAPWRPSPELILNGPFRFTRNPMYVGVTLFQVGLGITLDNLWISLLAFAALLAVHFIAVLPEEKYLAAKFAERYREYRARVRRYL